MNQMSNYILIVLFTGLAIWQGVGYFRTKGKITIYDKLWSGTRILFVAAAILGAATLLVYTGPIEFIRILSMLLCVVSYLLCRDGIGDEGVCVNGSFYPYGTVRAYDFQQEKKSFFAVFTVNEPGSSKNGNYNININFDLKDEEAVKALLKKRIGKKYTRMKVKR